MPFLTREVLNHNILHCMVEPGHKFSKHIHIFQKKKWSHLMSPKFFCLNSLVERTKKPPQETRDELAIVKAAAWAWYQHGSGSEGKAKSTEFDVTRIQRVARPSRYKLEAMRMAKEAPSDSVHTNSCKHLLDTYEVQSISRQLDRLVIESSHNNANNNDGNRRKIKNKKRVSKGCYNVVGGTALSNKKCVPVVNLTKCLPRSNHDPFSITRF